MLARQSVRALGFSFWLMAIDEKRADHEGSASGEIPTLVSTAFMELLAGQAIPLRVERRSLPEPLKILPRFLANSVVVVFQRIHHQANACMGREIQRLVGDQDAVFESRCRYLDHESILAQEMRFILARTTATNKLWAFRLPSPAINNGIRKELICGSVEQNATSGLGPKGLFRPRFGVNRSFDRTAS
jgi:hypothetical protein